MQVGDLVELSAAGRKSQQNMDVVTSFGMVIEIQKGKEYPYMVEWYRIPQTKWDTRKTRSLPCKRYELKLMKVKSE